MFNGAAFASHHGDDRRRVVQRDRSGLVMGLAITVLASAALGGILIPLTLTRLGADPAVSSGPFVTTITDVVGFFSLATLCRLAVTAARELGH